MKILVKCLLIIQCLLPLVTIAQTNPNTATDTTKKVNSNTTPDGKFGNRPDGQRRQRPDGQRGEGSQNFRNQNQGQNPNATTTLDTTRKAPKAETPPAIYGQIIDSVSRETLPAANVVLIHLPDSLKEATQTDIDGYFRFNSATNGRYLLQVLLIGYSPIVRSFNYDGTPFKFGRLQLKESTKSTAEVEVIGKIPPVQQLNDTTQFAAKAYKVNPDATTEDLVQKMPGITMVNGQIQAQGEQVKRVLVDGKPFFGDDPAAALKNLPAEVVDKIQVYDMKSDQARFTGFNDGNTIKTMNIITNPNAKSAKFGKFLAGYGTDDKYQASGTLNIFKGSRRITLLGISNNINQQNFSISDILGATGGGGGGGRPGGGGGGNDASSFLVNGGGGITRTNAMGLNFSDEYLAGKLKLSGSYFYNSAKNNTASSLSRYNILPSDSAQIYNETNSALNQNNNNRVNAFLEYNPDTNNSFEFRPSVTFQHANNFTNIAGETTKGTRALNATNSNTNLLTDGYNANGILQYRHRFQKRGRTVALTLNGGTNNSTGLNTQLSNNTYDNRSGTTVGASILDSIRQQSDSRQFAPNFGGTVTYSEPLGQFSQLLLSYNPSVSITDNDKITSRLDPTSGQYTTINTQLSNQFKSIYNTQGAGLGYAYSKGITNLTLRSTFQYSNLYNQQIYPATDTLSRSFFNVLPTMILALRFSKTKNLRVIYRTSTNAPSIFQLQNVVNNSNPLQLSVGTPGLRQTYAHNVFSRFFTTKPEAGKSIFGYFAGNVTQDYVGNSTTIATKDTSIDGIALKRGSQLARPTNLNGYFTAATGISIGMPLSKIKSNFNFDLNGSLSNTPGQINGVVNNSKSYNMGTALTLSSNISPNIDFTLTSAPSYNLVRNTLQTSLNTNYFKLNNTARVNLIFRDVWVYNTTVTHTLNQGLSAGFNQNFLLWNMAVARKFLKANAGELRLSVFDALHQNNSIARTSSDVSITDTRSLVLQRYYMLTFTYTLRAFGNKAPSTPDVNIDKMSPGERMRFMRQNGVSPGGPSNPN